jgi:MarR-like DNA-binding transcriptional regulator SgrR of sgrS sRNA
MNNYVIMEAFEEYHAGRPVIDQVYMYPSTETDANLVKNISAGLYDYAWSKSVSDAQAVAEEKQTGTLAVGATSVTLTFAKQTIGATTLVNWFVSDPTVNPTNVTTTANTVVLTFEAQSVALTVGALVKN